MYSEWVLDQLSWQVPCPGLLTAIAKMVAQRETIAAFTAAGTPTVLSLLRFGRFNGTVKRNGRLSRRGGSENDSPNHIPDASSSPCGKVEANRVLTQRLPMKAGPSSRLRVKGRRRARR
jgi:hypothetical protein